MSEVRVCGLVLAAGGSSRLGRPKQLLPYGSGTLLGHVLDVSRACAFAQLLCVVGGSGAAVRSGVDFSGVEVVENVAFGEGCSSSIAAALGAVDDRCDVLVLMLGDQPGVTAATVGALVDGRGNAVLAACRYSDGRGHPLAFARAVFGELGALHGDKGVWKLLDRRAPEVVDVPVAGRIPGDVDTWEDYEAVLAEAGLPRPARRSGRDRGELEVTVPGDLLEAVVARSAADPRPGM
jgi:molybdenum cofactor cytidylyltransferase